MASESLIGAPAVLSPGSVPGKRGGSGRGTRLIPVLVIEEELTAVEQRPVDVLERLVDVAALGEHWRQ